VGSPAVVGSWGAGGAIPIGMAVDRTGGDVTTSDDVTGCRSRAAMSVAYVEDGSLLDRPLLET
jgi:hypothetical protein